MAALHEALRRELAKRVIEAREVAECGAEAAVARLAVTEREPHGHLSADERILRNRLRARARALGDRLRTSGVQDVERLTEEVAYEAWHRMLFARFLAENGLLVHPEHGVAVTLDECEQLAPSEGAEDQWQLASRYAARMLPQIFRPDDPALQVAFAPEHRVALERLLEELAPEVFRADDSLGWVYQFWQAKRKDEVNAAGETITGETLPAVTQLFTEPYMVSFLLENTIGAWWAGRYPGQEPPVAMPYLRRLDDGTSAAGTFDGWPTTWREFTLLDPCCGSGHFLVAALRLLVPLRMHDEGLSAADAVDAVLRENLHGLELDARCTQIAAFAVALAAWTTRGAAGYRPLPALQIACSGLAAGAKRDDWLALAEGDQRSAAALGRLYDLFKLAPELGSLIDPAEGKADLLTAGFTDVAPLLERALTSEHVRKDEQREATAVAAQGVAKAATLLARKYTLIATNVPYLGRQYHGEALLSYVEKHHTTARSDLATIFLDRIFRWLTPGGHAAVVTPQNWLFLASYRDFRKYVLKNEHLRAVVKLGPGAFATIGGEVVKAALAIATHDRPEQNSEFFSGDISDVKGPAQKAAALQAAGKVNFTRLSQESQLRHPDAVIGLEISEDHPLLERYAAGLQGIASGDNARLRRCFWELWTLTADWTYLQSTPDTTAPYRGREYVILWENGRGFLAQSPQARVQGLRAAGRVGVAVNRMSGLAVTLHCRTLFDDATALVLPHNEAELLAIWAFCSSLEYAKEVRKVNQKVSVANATLVRVPFDLARWANVAREQYPDGLPAPHSDDPTQWLFDGVIAPSSSPLQVAVARLLGYRWPEQPADARLDALADTDGIVCLPAVRGEAPAVDRLQALLAAAYGADWSPRARDALLAEAGYAGKSLEQWLRDGCFEQHCKLFHQRPFVWHVWDGAKDGFAALVNYHTLTRATLETLTYTYLGDWIARQEEARKRDERGADVRLAKAKALQQELQRILAGEPPYDLFVRWKAPHAQPIGWDPDLNDGVRVNIWPFVQAGILRAKVNVNWKKDRGKNPPDSPWGEDRHNRYEDVPRDQRPAALRDVPHLTTEVRRHLRAKSGDGVAGATARVRPRASRR